MAVPTLYLFDRWDERIGVLPTLGTMTHSEELGGEDTLELDCLVAPEKGDRLVWRDSDTGAWREHEVVRTDEATGAACHVYAESSLCELLRDYVEECQLVSKTAEQAMAAVLGVTRWTLGDVSVGDAKRGALIYHTNALAALRRVESVWGGELECSYEVAGGRVSKRTVSLLDRRGGWHGARFSYAHNLVGCTRTVLEDEVFTALYGWGKGLPIEDESGNATGGYTRRLSFGDVNDGVKWVGDESAREAWGRWDASRGERVHAFGDVIFPECEDADELLALTKARLAEVSEPKVSYECDVAMLDGGVPVGLGDDVAVIDMSRTPEWRLTARCVRRVRTFGHAYAAGDLVLYQNAPYRCKAAHTASSSVTPANTDYWEAEGLDAPGKYAAVVGNGTSDTARSNACALDWEGNAYFAGRVYAGSGEAGDAAKRLCTVEEAEALVAGASGEPVDLSGYAQLSGAAFTGAVTGLTPTADAELATKGYVDGAVPSLDGYATEAWVKEYLAETFPDLSGVSY